MAGPDSAPSSSGPGRLAVSLPSWLPRGKVPRRLLLTAGILLVLALAGGLVALPLAGVVKVKDLEALGYLGIFVANFLGTATLFVPVPGLTAASQLLIVLAAGELLPLAVALVASAGMTLAESTAYLAGFLGRQLGEQTALPLKGRPGEALRRGAAFVDRMMLRYGFLTLLVLAAVPNPLFEFAGITAGAVRMNFWRFLLAVAIGKTLRALLLAFVGQPVLDLFT